MATGTRAISKSGRAISPVVESRFAGGNRFCQVAFNGESGNSRDASVHADGAKSRFPKRMASALRRRNSLRVAMQIGTEGGGACPCRRFHDCCPHFAQTEQNGETALLISLSQRSPISVRGATKCWPCLRPVHNAVIRVYDAAGTVIETHEHKGDFKEW